MKKPAAKPAPAKPLAFSYLRFSSIEQAKGDSVRRQLELRDLWLARNPNVALDESLSLRDEGKSAFTGEHRKNPDRHALAAFLRLVEEGRVPRGSYLIVENLDRLSREHIQPALILFLNLLQAGVRVVQLVPSEQTFDDRSEAMQIMMAVMELSRGNSESRMKSERIGRAWSALKAEARASKKPITSTLPAWLQMRNGKIVTRPERAAVVRRVFKAVAAGTGLVELAKALTAEKVPTFGRSDWWNPSSVHKIVHSRAAVGEYQPKKAKGKQADGEPIPDYFPRIVTDEQWWAAQGALKSRHNGGRRAVKLYNPFAGLLRDARDGAKIYITGASRKSNSQLVNYGSTRGMPGARRVSFPAEAFFAATLGNLREISPAEVEGAGESPDKVPELEGRLAAVEGRIAALQAALTGEGDVRAAVAALRTLEANRETVLGELTEARRAAASSFALNVQRCHSLIDALGARDNTEARERLRAAVARAVESVWCLFVARGTNKYNGRSRLAAVQVRFKGTPWVRSFLIAFTQGRGNAQTSTPASWYVLTDAWNAVAGEVDLSDRKQAGELEKVLLALDLSALA